MPSNHDYIQCLNCGGDALLDIERVFGFYTSVACLECGFRIRPAVSYLSLSELNACRISTYDWEYLKEDEGYDSVAVTLEQGDLPRRKFNSFSEVLKSAIPSVLDSEFPQELSNS